MLKDLVEKSIYILRETKVQFKNPCVLWSTGKDSRTLLDLCCGVGRVTEFIASRVKQYIGVDFSPTMIKKAKERYHSFHNVEFIVNDGWTLKEIPDATVDVVFCEIAFQHMEKRNTTSYVREVYRVLKDGGDFYAQVPKLDYYKDDTFAFTKEETDKLFIDYSVEYIPYDSYGQAYFLVKATTANGMKRLK